MDGISWRSAPAGSDCYERRFRQFAAVLSLMPMGVALLEPVHGEHGAGLQLAMTNEVAASYYGRIGDHVDPIVETERGMQSCGLLDLALLVSLTEQEHLQEAVAVPGAAAAGQLVDLAITPLGDGTVSIVFEDATLRVRG